MRKVIVRDLNSYFSYINSFPLLSRREELELAYKIKKGGVLSVAAFEKMVNSNLRLVVNIAKRFTRVSYRLSFSDLIQEGNVGLILAINKFKGEKGCRLSSYATYWIRQTIRSALRRESNELRLPTHTSVDISNFRKTSKELSTKLGREPSLEEISDKIKLTRTKGGGLKKVEMLEAISKRHFYSLNAPAVGTDTNLIEFIPNPSSIDPIKPIEKKTRRNRLRKILGSGLLTEKEVTIIKLRFGFTGDQDGQTLEKIGDEFGVTRERIRQIIETSLFKLKEKYSQELKYLY